MELNNKKINNALKKLSNKATSAFLKSEDYAELCQSVNVCKMYYDIDLGYERYIDPRTRKLVIADNFVDNKIILYDEGKKTDLTLKYTYFYDTVEYVHAYIEFPEGITKDELKLDIYDFLADQIFLLVSRQNCRIMLDYAENYDIQTSVPNVGYLYKFYAQQMTKAAPDKYCVIFSNLRNFKYINETGGTRTGDEVLIKFAHALVSYVDDDECVCRMGGDNFVMLIKQKNLDKFIEKLECWEITGINSAPDKTFDITAWMGITRLTTDDIPIRLRIEQSSVACSFAKHQLKRRVVFYDEQLAGMLRRSREITALFHPAVAKHEFTPFFQPKVNMLTGELIGMEALCRWKHDGKYIFPDQFIPILDQQGLTHDLDMAILNETCRAIRKWLDMGLEPPRVSFNISRKNLFIPHIEEIILDIIKNNNVSTDRLEIEITETAKEDEIDRLIDFLAILKKKGLQIAIDDFGTGYSSLSLIHNINADIIKIDKSFVSALDSNSKSSVLVKTIIQIAERLDMDVIAEGVETADEGKALIDMGCINAQGYYYSKPVDFESITEIIKNKGFAPIE